MSDASADRDPIEYDGFFSRFGAMFFADPVAAFANLGRALVPGDELAFVCWRPLAEKPFMLESTIAIGGERHLDEAASFLLGVGPGAAPLRLSNADAETIERARVAARERLRPFHGERGVELPGRVRIVTAARP